jgi:RNA polymerase sigma-70 factor (ECF subfamily)
MPTDVASVDEVREEVRALYTEHAESLRMGIRRLTWPGCDVDDLLQEVFVVVIRNPRPLLLAESPKAWLYGVAVKVASSARRKHRVRELLRLDAAAVTAPVASAQFDLEARATAAAVHRALGKISSKKREVLVLFELQGLTGPEIADALGCPLKTVWTRLHHARKDFEEQMVRHG